MKISEVLNPGKELKSEDWRNGGGMKIRVREETLVYLLGLWKK